MQLLHREATMFLAEIVQRYFVSESRIPQPDYTFPLENGATEECQIPSSLIDTNHNKVGPWKYSLLVSIVDHVVHSKNNYQQ